MVHLGDRTIGLDGVPAQQQNYRSMGFEPAYRTWRYSGRFVPKHVDPSVVAISSSSLATLMEFDRLHYPGPRSEFLGYWLDEPHIARAIFRDGRVAAYGVLRKCHEGYKIGPLFAGNENDARLIFAALCGCADGESVAIDVPEPAAGFSAHLEGLAFEKGFDTMRMYRGPTPAVRMSGVFGITTLELG